MSKKFDQEKYNKWDRSFSRWEDDYYQSSQEDQEGWLDEEYEEEEDDNYESRKRT